MKKRRIRFAALLAALTLVFSLSSCKGVEKAGFLPQNAPSQAGALPEETEMPPEEPREGDPDSEEASSPESEPVRPQGDAGSAVETPAEYPPAGEPVSSGALSLSSTEEKLNEVNIEAKAAQTSQEQAAVEKETPPQAEILAPAEPEKPVKPQQLREAVNSGEMKAVWLSFLEFQAFSGSGESAFTAKIETVFDDLLDKGLNTVIVQVRPHGDSFYDSAYYPWSKCVSGTMGVGVSYDPVEIMVREAHARGLSIHAWINPYRTMTETEFSTVDAGYPTKRWHDSDNRSEYMIYNQNDGRWWLQPGNAEVQRLIVDGVREIVERYEVDGVHLDDYFYCADPSAYGDTSAEARANTTALVKKLYNAVKAINGTVQFGISPSGAFRMENALPESDRNYLSTDLALWCSDTGYIDYVMPQIYWEHTHKTQPFTETLAKWESLVSAPEVKLYVGLAPYKLSAQEIAAQIDEIGAASSADGYCLFRYDFISGLSLPR